jgi:hypothetical protein
MVLIPSGINWNISRNINKVAVLQTKLKMKHLKKDIIVQDVAMWRGSPFFLICLF